MEQNSDRIDTIKLKKVISDIYYFMHGDVNEKILYALCDESVIVINP